MTSTLTLRILGCGSSGGVPRLGGDWGACDPNEAKNRRSRCSLLVTRETLAGTTRVLIDTSPDMRSQLLDAQTPALDAVLYTHPHADHVHGIDDLRMFALSMNKRLPLYMDSPTAEALSQRFGYIFETPEGSDYPPICDMLPLTGAVTIDGAGGPITLSPFEVVHGNIPALGFRIGSAAYLPDVSAIPEAAWPLLDGLDLWIVDALRYRPHPSHSHLEQTLSWIARAKPKSAVLTNLHTDLDYRTLERDLPLGIMPAYDGMELHIPH